MKSVLIKFIILLFLLSTLFSSCKGYDVATPQVVLPKILSVDDLKDTTKGLLFNSLTDFEWDRFMIIRPYQKEMVLTGCGYNFSLPSSKIDNTEGLDEYIFISKNKVVKHIINSDTGKAIIFRYPEKADTYQCGITKSENLSIKKMITPSEWPATTNFYLLYKKLSITH